MEEKQNATQHQEHKYILATSFHFLSKMTAKLKGTLSIVLQSKKEGKDQELIQSSTTPDTGYLWESDNFTIRHHKPELRGQPFPSR